MHKLFLKDITMFSLFIYTSRFKELRGLFGMEPHYFDPPLENEGDTLATNSHSKHPRHKNRSTFDTCDQFLRAPGPNTLWFFRGIATRTRCLRSRSRDCREETWLDNTMMILLLMLGKRTNELFVFAPEFLFICASSSF